MPPLTPIETVLSFCAMALKLNKAKRDTINMFFFMTQTFSSRNTKLPVKILGQSIAVTIYEERARRILSQKASRIVTRLHDDGSN